MRRPAPLLIALLLIFAAPPSLADEAVSVSIKSLSADMAAKLAMAAMRACDEKGYHVGAAVVDRGGNLMAFVRSPLAGPHTVDVAIAKAYTSSSFQTSTTAMMAMPELATAPRVLLVGGGLPINVGGHIYGAVGVSGAPFEKVIGDIDEDCAEIGIEAIAEEIEFAS